MKRLLTLCILALLFLAGTALAEDSTQTLLNPWTASSTILHLVPRNSAYGIKIATTSPLWLSGLNCTSYANGGNLTTDASGFVVCADDDGGAGGSGITSLNGLSSSSQTFATSTTGGLQLFINSSGSVHTFTLQPASGYVVPLSASTTEWSNLYTNVLSRLKIATSTAGSGITISTTTNSITLNIPTADGTHTGQLSSTDWTTFNNKQAALTTGNLTENITGLEFDATRQVIGGAAQLSLTSGYVIPLSASTTEWATAYGWGNHAGLYPTFSYASSSYATLWNLRAGSNITISTSSGVSIAVSSSPTFTSLSTTNASTSNITISGVLYTTGMANGCLQVTGGTATSTGTSCGSGAGGNSAWTIGASLIYNATSTDGVLIGTSTPTTSKLFIQGSGTMNPFTIASSTGSTLLTVLPSGKVGINSSTPSSLFTVDSQTSNATTTIQLDSLGTKGTCLKLKDADGSGYTYCSVNNGTMTCSTGSCE